MGECSVARNADTVTTPGFSNDAENVNNRYSANRASRGPSNEYETNTVTADRIAAHSTKKITLLTVGEDRTDPATDSVNIPTVSR
jgi:hypothetical protein